MKTLKASATALKPFERNAGSPTLDPEERTTPSLGLNEQVTIDASQRRASQPTSDGAGDLMSSIGDTIYCASGSPLPVTVETSVTQLGTADTALSTQQVTRPKRHAAVKARHTLAAAYQPLIIHAAHSERSPSVTSADSDIREPHDRADRTSALLVIDDLLPPANASEGDSDAYDGTKPRRRKQTRKREKRKRGRAGTDDGSVQGPKGKRRAEKLDRDDLRLIARAAQGLIGGEERKRSVKRKIKVEELLDGLRRVEAERFVRFVEETVDWNIAAVTLSEVTVRPSTGGGTAEETQLHTTGQGLLHSDPCPAILQMANFEKTMTAESLRKHWRDVLSNRIVSMYLD